MSWWHHYWIICGKIKQWHLWGVLQRRSRCCWGQCNRKTWSIYFWGPWIRKDRSKLRSEGSAGISQAKTVETSSLGRGGGSHHPDHPRADMVLIISVALVLLRVDLLALTARAWCSPLKRNSHTEQQHPDKASLRRQWSKTMWLRPNRNTVQTTKITKILPSCPTWGAADSLPIDQVGWSVTLVFSPSRFINMPNHRITPTSCQYPTQSKAPIP